MEEIYPPENYGATKNFNINDYFVNFGNILSNPEPQTDNVQYLMTVKDMMGSELSFNEISNLSNNCSIDLLTCEGENTESYPMKKPEHISARSTLPSPFITTEKNFLAVTKTLKEIEKQKKSAPMTLYKNRAILKELDFPTVSVPTDISPNSEFVMSVLVYKPFAFNFFNQKNASERLKFSHEILLLGRNTLIDLRDSMLCLSDFGICKEVEDTKADLDSLADAKNVYPSGFLFIDNIFYNDFRDPNAIDYSMPLLKWAKEKNIKNLQSKSIENVTLNTLCPRFGYPYLYMHQGDCEHLFVFADAKVLTANDCLHSACFPHIVKINRSSNRLCIMCTVSPAKWICVGSDRLPQHKTFLCTECCNSYMYLDGKKIGEFRLFPFYESSFF